MLHRFAFFSSSFIQSHLLQSLILNENIALKAVLRARTIPWTKVSGTVDLAMWRSDALLVIM